MTELTSLRRPRCLPIATNPKTTHRHRMLPALSKLQMNGVARVIMFNLRIWERQQDTPSKHLLRPSECCQSQVRGSGGRYRKLALVMLSMARGPGMPPVGVSRPYDSQSILHDGNRKRRGILVPLDSTTHPLTQRNRLIRKHCTSSFVSVGTHLYCLTFLCLTLGDHHSSPAATS